ncbi:MAG TPA: putative sulfate exporter family transporter [Pseudolabrys sp.]|nr:putative sulfate exporter family transporter [Pseudolabrys sp.]
MSAENSQALRPATATAFDYAPGVILSAIVAAAGYLAAPYVAHVAPIPNMVIALVIGIALNPIAVRPATQPGMRFCVSAVLRWAVALLGLRVGLADIAALGPGTALLIVIAMVATVISGFMFARWYGRGPGFGALVGVGTAVCGASATLAVSTVVPDYSGKQPDIAFVVVAVNALATVAMLIYPPLCLLLGFDPQTSGVMLGGTIHDVAQVVGAGYAVSTAVGNTAVIVKLFRVFLLLPVVLGVGWYFTRMGLKHGEARVPVPVFAIVFLVLCALNSAMPLAPSLLPVYAPVKAGLVEVSTWGLLLAIGALGLGTSVKTIIALGWRHITTVLGSTAVIFAVVTGGLLLMRVI